MGPDVTPPRPRKTRKSFDEPGHAHFLSYSCFQRLPLLARDRTRGWVLHAMDAMRTRLNVALWAYVIMPEHVHLLLYPQAPTYQMKRILEALKQPVARNARKWLLRNRERAWLARLTVTYPSRTVFRFWLPGGGYDQNIFRERTVAAIIRYIHGNPVRRGLVKCATDWPWSSARFWAGYQDAVLRMDQPFV